MRYHPLTIVGTIIQKVPGPDGTVQDDVEKRLVLHTEI